VRILVSNPDTLGDLVLRQPLFSVLAARGHELLLIVRRENLAIAPLVAPGAAVVTLDFDPYLPPEAWDEAAVARVFREVEAFSPELFAIAPYQWTLFEERLAERLAKVPRVAMRGKLYRGKIDDGLDEKTAFDLTTSVEVDEDLHELKKNERLASAILGESLALPAPSLAVPESCRALARERLASWGFGDAPFVVACVGHSRYTSVRNWPVDAWASVIAHWAASSEKRFVLVGSEAERETLDEIRSKLGAYASRAVVSAGEESTLDLLVGLTHLSDAYLGRDTGPMHVAAACGKPVIAVFGGGTWPRFLPAATPSYAVTVGVPCVGCDWLCHLPESYCVKRVPVAEVRAAIENLEAGRLTGSVSRILEPGPALDAQLARESAKAVRERVRTIGRLTRNELRLAERAREADRLGAVETRLRRELAEAASTLNAVEAAARDLEIRFTRAESDRGVAFTFAEQKERERKGEATAKEQALGERDEARRLLEETRGHLATTEAERQRLAAELAETRADLTARIEALGREINLQQGRVGALVTSRWRKIGKATRLASPFPWESDY